VGVPSPWEKVFAFFAKIALVTDPTLTSRNQPPPQRHKEHKDFLCELCVFVVKKSLLFCKDLTIK
jgi:hypothetical protein